jgi:hypothetical protein
MGVDTDGIEIGIFAELDPIQLFGFIDVIPK